MDAGQRPNEEARKLRQHLELLKEEHVKVQEELARVQRKSEILSAHARLHGEGDGDTQDQDSFIHRLAQTVTQLFEKDLYSKYTCFSDITIHLDGHQLRAHRFVLAARSDTWGVPDLSAVEKLEFDGIPYNIGYTLLNWVYTDKVDTKLGDSFLLDLMKTAKRFHLTSLFTRCEHLLMSRLDVKNCISIYESAVHIEANRLTERCSQLISLRWDEFGSEDFEHMPPQLLYKMLLTKVDFPLHEAIRLRREDVVFLYLLEFDSQLNRKLNEFDAKGALPLNLALSTGQETIAKTLVSQRADIDAQDSDGNSLLLSAVIRRDEFACKFLLENGANPNYVNPNSMMTPLHMLCSFPEKEVSSTTSPDNGMSRILDLLLQRETKINSKESLGRTALFVATVAENTAVFSRLLSVNKIELDCEDSSGETPLSTALRAGTEKSMKMAGNLVSHGADVDRTLGSDRNSLLHICTSIESMESVEFLLKNGAKVNASNVKGETPLHIACENGFLDLARILLTHGADPNHQNNKENGLQSPLHLAVANSHADVVTEILNYKSRGSEIVPDLTLANAEGETALGYSLWNRLYEISARLISGGANVNATYPDGFSLLLRAIQNEDEESALFLLQNGANAGCRSPTGAYSLQMSVSARLSSVVRSLCQAGADMNIRDEEGLPPLWTALAGGDEDSASALVEYGCDTNAWGRGPSGSQLTLLHRAIDDNNESAACFLIRSLCDVNAVQREGPDGEGREEAAENQTPLHMCAIWGLKDTVASLLEHGAKINAQDGEGKTAVHLAVENHHEEILKMLLRHPEVNLTLKDGRGTTPFAAAMQVKNNIGARMILEREPRVGSQVDSKGYNFIHTAVKNGDFESVLFLLSVNMDVNMPTQDSTRQTPLHLACSVGNEMILRNLLLAGAEINALTGRGQTGLHIAAEFDHSQLCSILLENAINFDMLDASQNNAVHVAVQKGNVGCVRVLLAESHINAEAVNMKGQTPLHLLGLYGKDNAGTIFEVFMDSMPKYDIDRVDLDGNTMLLLAYMNGNAQLCRAAVRYGACLGTLNLDGVSIFNFQTPTKQLLFRLLDELTKEPRWADGDSCSECGGRFSITVRKHHCRHCGRLLCSKCSEKTMPILKYDLNKPVRVCDVCSDVLTLGSQ